MSNISDAPFRNIGEAEVIALTALGNTAQIRRHEVGKHPVPTEGQDYVPARMVNLV